VINHRMELSTQYGVGRQSKKPKKTTLNFKQITATESGFSKQKSAATGKRKLNKEEIMKNFKQGE